MKHRPRRFSPGGLGAVLLAAALSLWIWTGTGGAVRISGRQKDYDNLLIHGFLKGHLYLDAAVPAELLALKNPYEPSQRRQGLALHDASLYRGHYYIYFGPAPAVLIMLPFVVLTRQDLPLSYAVALLVAGATAALLAIFWRYRKIHHPALNRGLSLTACALALGTCAFQLVLLSRHSLYDLAIAGGACFFLWSLYFLLAPNPARRSWPHLLAGVFLGLAVASRPTYLFTAPLLVIPWMRRPRDYRGLWASIASCGVIVGFLLLYNYARFGQFLEFGQHYQLSGAIEGQVRHFSLQNVPFNLRVYFLSALRYGRYFPFVHPIQVPPLPAGFGGYEGAFGLIPNFPFYLFGIVGAYLAARPKGPRAGTATELRAIAFAALALTAVLCLFFGSVVRYEADFGGLMLLLACCGVVELDSRLRSRAAKRVVGGLALATAAFSAFVAVMTALTLYGKFPDNSPRQYANLSRWLDRPAAELEKTGLLSAGGPRTLRLRLLPDTGMAGEPVVTTGWAPNVDSVWAQYPRSGVVCFQWKHGTAGVQATSPAYELGGRVIHQLTVQMASFYPPAIGSGDREQSSETADASPAQVALSWDGQPPWHVTAGCFDSTPGTVRYGACVESATPASPLAINYVLPTRRFDLDVVVQAEWSGRKLPLATRGRNAAGDTLYLHVVDRGTIRFGFDHWGQPVLVSPPIPWVMARHQTLTIEFPGPSPQSRRAALEISSRGQALWAPVVEFYPAKAYELFPAQNLIGSTTCESIFPDCTVLKSVNTAVPAGR
jgi:hypothetical protein